MPIVVDRDPSGPFRSGDFKGNEYQLAACQKLVMAAIDISDQRRRQFVGIDLVEQWNLNCVENATHGFELAARRCANAASFAKVKLNRRSWSVLAASTDSPPGIQRSRLGEEIGPREY
jgi:hypothetical protein